MNNKHAIRTYKSLALQGICDDVIDTIVDYVGDFNETPSDLVNQYLILKVEQHYRDADGVLLHINTVGHYCCVCRQFYEMKTEKGIARHTSSQKHKKNSVSHLKKSHKVSVDVNEIIDIVANKYIWNLFTECFEKFRKQLQVVMN